MKHSTSDLLAIIDQFYPRNRWPDEVGYSDTPEDRRLMAAATQAGQGVAYDRWLGLLNRLQAAAEGAIINASLHLVAGNRGPCYEGVWSLLKTDDEQHRLCFCVSLLAPYYVVYGWRYFREGHRSEVHFELDDLERPLGRQIAAEIEATYGYEPMAPGVGGVSVASVEILGQRYHYFGKGTINDYLFVINR